jgi:hypothetical protein
LYDSYVEGVVTSSIIELIVDEDFDATDGGEGAVGMP